MALEVLCSSYELEESGDVVTVGDYISRHVSRWNTVYYGTELDDIKWNFDSEAEADGSTATTISGDVTAISAIFVRLTHVPGKGWTPVSGSAHAERIESTADTRQIKPEIDWVPVSTPDAHGHAYSAGYPRTEEGDEHHSGWLITLEPYRIDAPRDGA